MNEPSPHRLPAAAAHSTAIVLGLTLLLVALWGWLVTFGPLVSLSPLLWNELHGALEAVNVVLALTLFLMILNTRRELNTPPRTLFGATFLAVAMLRLAHLLIHPLLANDQSLMGSWSHSPPDEHLLISQRGLFLALAAEYLVAQAFLVRSFQWAYPPPGKRWMWPLVVAWASAGGALCYWGWHYAPGSEILVLLEHATLGLWLLAVALAVRRAWRYPTESWVCFACSVGLFFLAQILMSFGMGDQNYLLWGHLLQTTAFVMTYRTVYLHVIEEPMQQLAASRDELAQQEARYRKIFEASRMPTLLIDPAQNGQIVSANQAACDFYQYNVEQLTALKISDINQLAPAQIAEEMARASREERDHFFFPHKLANGTVRQVEVYSGPIDLDGRALLFSISHDITQQKLLEAQRIQGHRLEAIGQITGGVAHDFNNLLQVIVGNLELLQGLKHDQVECVKAALQAAVEGGELTHRLLAYARHQSLQRRQVDLNELIRQFIERLQHTFPEDIAFVVNLQQRLPTIETDPVQLETALLNVALNARDAMPHGGMLYFVTESQRIADRDWVRILVQDTGCGMDQHTVEHAIEPFFTTKTVGQGSGLGLSAAYGFVKQCGGELRLSSARDLGTTVTIDLPLRTAPAATPAALDSVELPLPAHSATVLVVEDNPAVRQLTVRQLKQAGYKTYQVPHGQAALNYLLQGLETDVVVSDLALSGGVSGLALAQWVEKYRPDIGVVLMSNFAEEARDTPGQFLLLQKPFTPPQLLSTVATLLEKRRLMIPLRAS